MGHVKFGQDGSVTEVKPEKKNNNNQNKNYQYNRDDKNQGNTSKNNEKYQKNNKGRPYNNERYNNKRTFDQSFPKNNDNKNSKYNKKSYNNDNKKPRYNKKDDNNNNEGEGGLINWASSLEESWNAAKYDLDAAKQQRDVVLFNQLISHFGTQKHLPLALRTFEELTKMKPELYPTVYTFSALINSCVRCGEVQDAKKFHQQMIDEYEIEPNEITFTTLIKGLCTTDNANSIREACNTLKIMKEWNVYPNIRTFNTILRGCLRVGLYKEAQKMFAELKKLKITPDETTYGYLSKALCEAFELKEASKLMQEMHSKKMDHSPAWSALSTSYSLLGDFDKCSEAIKTARLVMSDDLKKNGVTGAGKANLKSVPMFLKLRNEEVDLEIKRAEKFIQQVKQDEQKRNCITKFGIFLKSTRVAFVDGMSDEDKIVPDDIFSNKDRPKKLEICSGLGDWIVDKASKDNKSDWMALEMRHERVFQIWSRMCFENLSNMSVICSEAHAALRERLPESCCDEVYINYPDPPFWEGSKQRLIDAPFLRQVHRVMKPGSNLIIVTDNVGYKNLMLEALKECDDLFESTLGRPFTNKLPEDYGTSYFDRFWNNSRKVTRFYLNYKKI
ncbi:tRNA methyltransferase [Acrasis kona]|uniref:tRNA (guanine(46)-N(7))-methyltransferase n=1 Tax=Acrasis kona TaxID=1008807 RepID=A0AAW2Z5Y2_9EUKA